MYYSPMLRQKLHALLKGRCHSPAEYMRIGMEGERLAERYLKHEGFHILAKNVRMGRDEIDLIVRDPVDDVLVFLEVKSRAHADADFPAMMSAGPTKMRKILRAARRWIAAHGYDGGYRMDILCVEGGQITQHLREVSWE